MTRHDDHLGGWEHPAVLADICATLGRPVPAEPWLIIGVVDPHPADDGTGTFAYTVGLTDSPLGHDLWVSCEDPVAAATIIRCTVAAALDGARVADGAALDPDALGLNVALRLRTPGDVEAVEAILSRGPLLQVVWPDPAGAFPGDGAYDAAEYPQLLP